MAEFPVNIRGNRVTPQRLSLRVGDTSAVLDVKFQLASVGQQLSAYQGEWQSASSYNSGDVVLYNGSTYQANQSISSGGADPEASASWDLYGYVTAQIDRWFEDTNQIIAAGLSMDITSVSPVVRARLAIDHTSYLPDEDTFAIHFRVHEDGDMNRYPDRDALFVDADPEGGDGYTDDELNNLFVPLSREVNAGTGLSGGGNLSQDRVFSLDADFGQLNDTSLSPSDSHIVAYDSSSGEWVSQELTADLISGGGTGTFFGEDSIEAGRFLSKSYNSSTETLRLDVDALNTDDITEAGNKYYTDERVDDRVATLVQGGQNTTVTYDDTSGELLIETAGGGGTGSLDLGEYSFQYDSTNDELEVQYSDGTAVFWMDNVGNIYARRDVIAYASGPDSSTDTTNSRLGVVDESGTLLTQDAKQIEFTGGVNVTEPSEDEILVSVQGKTTEQVQDDVSNLLVGGNGITLTYDDAGDSLTIDGAAQYTDSDAIAAINNDADHGSTASHNYYTDSDAVDAYNSYLGNYQFAYDSSNDELEIQYQDGTPLFWVDDTGNVYAKRDVIAYADGAGSGTDTTNSELGVLDESGSLLTQDAKQIEFTGGVIVTEPNADEILVDVQGKTTEEVQDDVSNFLVGGTGISLSYDDPSNTLTINGVSQYTDSDAISAINNDSDHGSTASHNYYTDSDAIAAINSDADHGSTASHNYYTDSDAVDAYNSSLGNYQFAYDGTNDELEVQYQDGTPLFWVDDAGNVYAKSDVVAFASGSGTGGSTTNSRLGVLDESGTLLTDDAKQIEFTGGLTVTEPNPDEILVDVAGKTTEEVQDDVAALLSGGTGINLTYDDAGDTLTIDGTAQYTDADAIAAINNDSDHGSTASHNYYTDSDAISAINNDGDHGSTASHNYYTDSDAVSAINNDTDHGSTASHNYFSGSHSDLSGITSDDHHTRYTDAEARSAVNNSSPSLTTVELSNEEYSDYTSAVGGELVYDASTGLGLYYGSSGSGITKGQATLLDTNNTSVGSNLSLTGGSSDSSVPNLSIINNPAFEHISAGTSSDSNVTAKFISNGSFPYAGGRPYRALRATSEYTGGNTDYVEGAILVADVNTDADIGVLVNGATIQSLHSGAGQIEDMYGSKYFVRGDGSGSIQNAEALRLQVRADGASEGGDQINTLSLIRADDVGAINGAPQPTNTRLFNLPSSEININNGYTFYDGSGLDWYISGKVGIGTSNPNRAFDLSGNMDLNDNALYLRGDFDENHYIQYSSGYDGPRVAGYSGGELYTTQNAQTQLWWDEEGVSANGLRIHGRRPELGTYTASSNNPALEFDVSNGNLIIAHGSTAPYRINLQDGLGRVHHRWNAYDNGSGTSYDVSGEGAAWLEIGGGSFDFRVSGSGTADNSISWTDILQLRTDGADVDGFINAAGEVEAFTSSDHRLKDGLTRIDSAARLVEQINGYTFTWNEDAPDYKSGRGGHGVIAQEIQDILPEAVRENAGGYLGVQYEQIIPVLIEAVKEQQETIDNLKSQIQ